MPFSKAMLAVALTTPIFAGDTGPVNETLVAHEWGTFTSVAGKAGNPIQWMPLSGSADLPCFVSRLRTDNIKAAHFGAVRMETPVIYFYAQRPMTLSVHVDFPHGWITEWYPQATRVKPEALDWNGPRMGQIDWERVQLLPGDDLSYPSSKGASHYFAARNTDSSPLQIGKQQEKLIFYRGIGNLPVPLRPRFDADGKIEIRNAGPEAVALAILFENRNGRVGYRLVRDLKEPVRLDPPELTADPGEIQHQLAGALTEAGLYRTEALAMIETWKDSWFEDGMRVFYVVPRSLVDAELPLAITPAPVGLGRVFIGRIEVLSPWVRSTIVNALTNGDAPALVKFGRFLDPFLAMILTQAPPASSRATMQQVYAKLAREFNAGCVQ